MKGCLFNLKNLSTRGTEKTNTTSPQPENTDAATEQHIKRHLFSFPTS